MIDYQVNAIHIFVLKSQHLWSIYQITIQHCNHNVFAVLGLVEILVELEVQKFCCTNGEKEIK